MQKIAHLRPVLVIASMVVTLAVHAQHPINNPLNWRTVHPEKATDFEADRVPDALCAPNDSTLVITSGIHGNRLYRTTDRGLTWQISAGPAPAGSKTFFTGLQGVVSYDSSATLPARRRGQLRFTTDGGDSWSAPRAVPTGKTVFLSATEALVFQQRQPAGLVIFRTTNAGLTWSVRDSLSGLPHLSNIISVPSPNTAYMFAGDSVVREVIQLALGRHTWRRRVLPSAVVNGYASVIQEIYFSTDSSGLARDASGFDQRIFATTNGGRTWVVKPLPPMTGGVNNSFALLDAQHLLAHDDFPGQVSDMLRLSANGQNWQRIPMDDYTAAPDGPGDPYQMGGLQTAFANSEYAPMLLRPSGVGWTTGTDGRIWYSADFGATWTLRSRVLQADEVIAMNFPDPGHGYVAARADAVIRTLDQGQTWTRLTGSPPFEIFSAAAFPDADTLFLATSSSSTAKLYRSVDGGQTWAPSTVPTMQDLTALAFYQGARQGLAVGTNGTILRTMNGGQTWVTGTAGTTAAIQHVTWASPQIAFATSRSSVLKSTDAGATWQPLTTVPTATSYGAITFPTATLGFLNADNNKAYRTTDSGLTWTLLPGISVDQVRFVSLGTGWTRSSMTLDGGQTWTALPIRMRGLVAPIDDDNIYTVSSTDQGIAPTAHVQRYSRHFLRAAPLAQTTLTTGASLSVAFTTEGPFAANERDFRVELSNSVGRFRRGQTSTIGQGTASPIAVTLPANLPPGTHYRLRVVRADSSVLGSDNGQDLTLRRLNGLAPEIDASVGPQLYPNPAQQTVSVRFAEGAQAGRQVRLLDLTGRVVLVQPATAAETPVSLRGLGAGCYLLEVRASGGHIQTQRLMVQP
jgi:photosystem II stability/assembly factor-like uncharacterized protein